MVKRNFIVIWAAFFLAVFAAIAHAQLPQSASGLAYLATAQNADGAWDTSTAVETTAATVAVLDTLKLMGQTAAPPYTTGAAWLQAQSPQPVQQMAQRIQILGLSDLGTLIPAADAAKGGWGGDLGYETNNLDTIVALAAVKGGNYPTTVYSALAYLTGSQNADGGWGFNRGDASNVYMTSVISALLQQFPQMTSIATAINKATAYIADHQNADGGFGTSASTVFETALAYSALAAVSTDATALRGGISYLTALQASNGSWQQDPYVTALALKALHLSEQKPPPPPPPAAGGRFTGIVLDAVTNQKLNGVVVVLESIPLIKTSTDAFGNFSLDDVPAGSHTVNFSFNGYKPASAMASVTEGGVASLGYVQMVSSYSTGQISGTIYDPAGLALAGVEITVSGAWSGSTVTGPDGAFLFTYVTPGEVRIAAAKTGYQTVTSSGVVFARTTLTFSPRMSTTPSQLTTGSIVGRVVSAWRDVPIDHLPEEEGVTVTVSGGIKIPVEADNGGYFNVQGLAPNTYQVTVGMAGFGYHTFRVLVMPGATIDLGTIRLDWSFDMVLTGKVTDATTGSPISGAEVAVVGSDLTGRTDDAGRYVIPDIGFANFTVKASATGYNAKTFSVGSAPWIQTMDISLSPQVNTGSLKGVVYDQASNLPLSGVKLTLVGDASVTATTDGSGLFTFNVMPKDVQQVKLALAGYAERILTTRITAGKMNDVGRVALSVSPLPATVEGVVWDAVANAPFAGVEIQVTGTGFWQAYTAADGSYRITNVNPGAVSVAALDPPKPGYFGARFTGNLAPGGVLIFNPALSQTPPPGTLKGTVTDFSDNHPIQGATVMLSPATAGVDPGFSDLSGAFYITGIPVGKYTASIYAPGYTTQSTTVDIISGYLGDTVIGVQMEKIGTSTTIAGKVTDSTTGDPVADATVSIAGTALSMTTGPDGSYIISGISAMEFTVEVTATGYDPLSYGIRTGSYGNYSVNLRLSKVGLNSSRIFGVVRDAVTNTGMGGVEVSIIGGNKSAVTAADGSYSITGVSQMVMNLKASAPGYDSKFAPLTLNAYGEYEVPFALSLSRASSFVIRSIAVDKPSYQANETVAITAEIENSGDAAAELSLEAEVSDQYGQVLGLISLGTPVTLAGHTVQSVTLQWDTGQHPPGPHEVTLSLIDRLEGGVLAERRTELAIASTASVEGLVSVPPEVHQRNGDPDGGAYRLSDQQVQRGRGADGAVHHTVA